MGNYSSRQDDRDKGDKPTIESSLRNVITVAAIAIPPRAGFEATLISLFLNRY
ncbi:MAG: hypothetical protein MUE44_28455 [Oscillatoriaceae cyanobacterium Prado104]|nr:hypothetical protein [Oscillatoriaceae cyanobacterium Prado104]